MSLNTFEDEKNFFGFHPLSFIDDVLNTTDDYCADVVDELEKYLLSKKELQSKTKEVKKVLYSLCNEGSNSNGRDQRDY